MKALAAITVVAAWVASLGVGIAEHDWTALTITMPAAMLFLGYTFGVSIIRRQNTDEHDRSELTDPTHVERWSHLE
jgi:hypothetical protein